jgi:hypothetical protein
MDWMTFTNKYALLVIVNLPILIIAILGAITSYKTKRSSKRRCIVEVAFWCAVGVLLICIEPIYNALVRHNLTNSAPMSIFDLVLLTLFILCLLLIRKLNEKVTELNKKLSKLHENIVIAEEQRHWDK